MKQELIDQAMGRIESSERPSELKTMIRHGRSNNLPDLVRAAQRRLYSILPSAKPGTLEFDVWQSIHALEDALSNERGKTVRLSRTRQMITRVGEHQTIIALVMKKVPSEGFKMLVERDMSDLAFEAVALKHAGSFDEATLALCRQRMSLVASNADIDG